MITLEATTPGRGAASRILGLVRRHFYIIRRSVPRIIEMIYWPTLQIVLWGFISSYVATESSGAMLAAGILLGGAMLWDMLFRANVTFAVGFIEEIWSRNLGHLYVSPLRPWEHVAALMAVSLIRTLLGAVPAVILAIVLYAFNIFSVGLPLVALFLNLMITGWALGLLVCSLILRYGISAEILAWALIFLLAPFSAVYYPVSILPEWLQAFALALPSTHVFEGMREALVEGSMAWSHMAWALGLNGVMIALFGGLFAAMLRQARRRGSLLNLSE